MRMLNILGAADNGCWGVLGFLCAGGRGLVEAEAGVACLAHPPSGPVQNAWEGRPGEPEEPAGK